LLAGSSLHSVIISLEESPDLDSTSLEALQDFFGFITQQEKQLFLARLKHPVYELLKQLVPSNLQMPSFTDLSVDEAVKLASDKK